MDAPQNRAPPGSSRRFKNNCIKGLILGAGGDILLSQDGQKPFQFMFTWQMQREPFEEVAISPEPGAVSALGCECKMLASNNFRKPPHRFVGIHLAIVIHEQPVVYQLLGIRFIGYNSSSPLLNRRDSCAC